MHYTCLCVCMYLYVQALLLRSLTDAVLHHFDQHHLHVTDVDSLSTDDELGQIAAKAMVNDVQL